MFLFKFVFNKKPLSAIPCNYIIACLINENTKIVHNDSNKILNYLQIEYLKLVSPKIVNLI